MESAAPQIARIAAHWEGSRTIPAGAVALLDREVRWSRDRALGSDGAGELGERCGDSETTWGVKSEFVMPAA